MPLHVDEFFVLERSLLLLRLKLECPGCLWDLHLGKVSVLFWEKMGVITSIPHLLYACLSE